MLSSKLMRPAPTSPGLFRTDDQERARAVNEKLPPVEREANSDGGHNLSTTLDTRRLRKLLSQRVTEASPQAKHAALQRRSAAHEFESTRLSRHIQNHQAKRSHAKEQEMPIEHEAAVVACFAMLDHDEAPDKSVTISEDQLRIYLRALGFAPEEQKQMNEAAAAHISRTNPSHRGLTLPAVLQLVAQGPKSRSTRERARPSF
jgi:hypothetical protein